MSAFLKVFLGIPLIVALIVLVFHGAIWLLTKLAELLGWDPEMTIGIALGVGAWALFAYLLSQLVNL